MLPISGSVSSTDTTTQTAAVGPTEQALRSSGVWGMITSTIATGGSKTSAETTASGEVPAWVWVVVVAAGAVLFLFWSRR